MHSSLTSEAKLQTSRRKSENMTIRRSIWKGSFVDACLMRIKDRKDMMEKKIWSRRSTILPEWLDTYVKIHNGKTFVRVKITEDKVGHKFGEFALTRKPRKPMVVPAKNAKPGKKK